MKRQRRVSPHVMQDERTTGGELQNATCTLWSAVRIEQRATVERTTLSFGQCGWRHGAGDRE